MNQTEARIFGFFVATMRREQEWTLESLATRPIIPIP